MAGALNSRVRGMAWVVAAFSAGAYAPAGAKPASDPHKLWAYPSGVIATSDGGRVSSVKMEGEKKADEAKDKDKEKEPAPEVNTISEVSALAKQMEKHLAECLAGVRAEAPATYEKEGVKVSFAVDFMVAADGGLSEQNLTKHGDSANLPSCTDGVRKLLDAHHFAAPSDNHAQAAKIEFEGLILSEEAAKGRGYKYFEAENTWEQTLKAHPAWFACSKNTDCVVNTDKCEVRGVNAAAADEYKKAIAERQKPGCLDPKEADDYAATCRHGTCAARPKP